MTKRGFGWIAGGCLSALVLAWVIVLIVSKTLFPTFRTTTAAMEPTLELGDSVVTDKSSSPRRGDMIAFRYPLKDDVTFLKRVVALPGETVEVREKRLYINGVPATDPHAFHGDERIYADNPAFPEPYRSRDQFGPFHVPQDHFFVMGDNRDFSSDSRYWGAVPRKNIRGKVMLVAAAKNGFWRP
jgi:signal peptidase I